MQAHTTSFLRCGSTQSRSRPPTADLLGGTSPRAFQRAAMYADGWAPWMIDPEGLATGREQLLDAFARAGRTRLRPR